MFIFEASLKLVSPMIKKTWRSDNQDSMILSLYRFYDRQLFAHIPIIPQNNPSRTLEVEWNKAKLMLNQRVLTIFKEAWLLQKRVSIQLKYWQLLWKIQRLMNFKGNIRNRWYDDSKLLCKSLEWIEHFDLN